MKKIIIVLFVFMLSGCSVQDKIDNLEKDGYRKREPESGVTFYTKKIESGDEDAQLVVSINQENEFIGLGVQQIKNDKRISISLDINGINDNSCIVFEKDLEFKNSKIVNCDEAYQLILEENPILIEKFQENIKKFKVSYIPNETKVSDELKNIFDESVIIDNLAFKKAENQPEYDPKVGSLNTFLKNMELSFDILNTSTTAEIDVEKALENYGLCNVEDQNDIKCDNLLNEKEIEKYKDEIIKPNEKKTIIFEKKTIESEPKYHFGILNKNSSSQIND